ncbi:MAG: hypothetical protein D6785_03165 [Planctomycetota bacterium]|nr:MAG: hypothetical protein D6785_03165 [Planctomycetota bacterium]
MIPMDFHDIPEEYRQYLFEEIPLDTWKNLFQKEPRFQSRIKGFRPSKAPKKVVQNTVVKLLEEDLEFLKTALDFWREDHPSPFALIHKEHIQKNFQAFEKKLGPQALFWHLLSTEDPEISELAWKILKGNMKKDGKQNKKKDSSSNKNKKKEASKEIPEIRYTEKELNKLIEDILDREKEKFKKSQEEWMEKEQLWQVQEKKLLLECQKWREKYESLEKKWKKEKEKIKTLQKKIEEQEKKIHSLIKEKEKIQKEFPSDFQPCTLVLKLESRLKSLNEKLEKMEEKELALLSLKAQQKEGKKSQAEYMQQIKELTDANVSLQKELEEVKSQKDKVLVLEIKKPENISERAEKEKVLWPKQAHHYPRRLEAFLDKVAKIPFVDTIQFKTFENTSQSRIKEIDSSGDIVLLFSDGQKGVKMVVRTTASNAGEGAYIAREIQKIEPSILL